ncbi:hypothetical protein P12x_002790 [Tundrisphaera lichenicola]|uniref:hypothetical protein n=1 Tax=Tundrisphaera lichenicola TaxID=2029860 RepID=UPI003EBEA099
MSTSEARVAANRRNALLSTGPKTPEGKARSRENAVKHGLTGEGVVLPAEEAVEVERLRRSFEAELQPSGEVGRTLVRRLALLAVRMDRCVIQESAALAEHIRRSVEDFDAEWPTEEGADDPDRERMRDLTARRALFDPSKEATLARKYEAAAERGFFRSLREFRQVEREAKAESPRREVEASRSELGSFLTEVARSSIPLVVPESVLDLAPNPRPKPVQDWANSPPSPASGSFDVPFSIGRAR